MAANLEVRTGDCLPISLALKQADGSNFDLTGYTAVLDVKWDDEELDPGSPSVDSGEGTITLTMTGSLTEQLPLGKKARLMLELTSPDGCVKTIEIGKIRVRD